MENVATQNANVVTHHKSAVRDEVGRRKAPSRCKRYFYLPRVSMIITFPLIFHDRKHEHLALSVAGFW